MARFTADKVRKKLLTLEAIILFLKEVFNYDVSMTGVKYISIYSSLFISW